MNPLKGPLKLKGDATLVSKKKSKKKKKDKDKTEQEPASAAVETKGGDVKPSVVHKCAALTVACHARIHSRSIGHAPDSTSTLIVCVSLYLNAADWRISSLY